MYTLEIEYVLCLTHIYFILFRMYEYVDDVMINKLQIHLKALLNS